MSISQLETALAPANYWPIPQNVAEQECARYAKDGRMQSFPHVVRLEMYDWTACIPEQMRELFKNFYPDEKVITPMFNPGMSSWAQHWFLDSRTSDPSLLQMMFTYPSDPSLVFIMDQCIPTFKNGEIPPTGRLFALPGPGRASDLFIRVKTFLGYPTTSAPL